MSETIDRRIVEMQFDNKDFESNVQTSVKSLEKLKEGLELDEAAKGLKGIEKAGKRFNLDHISEAAEAVTSKFSILGTVGDQVVRRLTDGFMNVVAKMIHLKNMITIDPIRMGLSEYETQINSIQTILSNTHDAMTEMGYDTAQSIDVINGKLDELNFYADKTIYNFTQMTENIGRFTAAGVELEPAVNAIKGIANMAALSGANAEKASSAMYMYSQAMSSGVMRAYQWNSITIAGMGGQMVQDAYKEYAKAKKLKVMYKKRGSKDKETMTDVTKIIEDVGFKESLQYGWMTEDVISAVLDQYSWDFDELAKDEIRDRGFDPDKFDKDSWGFQQMRKVAKEKKKLDLVAEGYSLEEAQKRVDEAEMGMEAATKVKTFTQLIDTLQEALQSGWTMTWRTIIGDFEEAKELFTGLNDFFSDLIEKTSKSRNDMINEWKEKGGRDLLFNQDPKKGPIGAIWNLLDGIVNFVGTIKEGIGEVFEGLNADKLFNLTKAIHQVTVNFKEWTEDAENMDKIKRIAKGVASVFSLIGDAIGVVVGLVKSLFTGLTSNVKKSGGILDFFASIGDWLTAITDKIKNSQFVQTLFTRLGTAFATVGSTIVRVAKMIWGWIVKIWGYIQNSGIFTKIGEWFSKIIGKIPYYIASIHDWLIKLWGTIKESTFFQSLIAGIKGVMAKLPGIVTKIKEWAVSMFTAIKNSERLKTALTWLKDLFKSIGTAITNFAKKFTKASKAMSSLDTGDKQGFWEKIKAKFTAFVNAFKDGGSSVKEAIPKVWEKIKSAVGNFFTKTLPDFFSGDKFAKVIEALKGFWEKLKRIVKNIFVVSGPVFEFVGTTLRTAFGTLHDAVIAPLLKMASSGDWGSILKIVGGLFVGIKALTAIKGIKNIGAGFANFGKGFSNLAKNGFKFTKKTKEIVKHKDSIGNTLLKVAAAFALMVGSIWLITQMGEERVMKGLFFMGIIAAELAVVCMAFKAVDIDGKKFFLMSLGIGILAGIIWLLGSMEPGKALKGVIALGAVMIEFGVMAKLAGGSESGGKLKGMITTAIAMWILGKVVENLGSLSLGQAIQGVFALSAIMGQIILVSRLAGGHQPKGLILMAVAVNLLVFAAKRLAKLNPGKLIAGVGGLSILMGSFGAMALMTKGASFKSSLLTLIMLAGTMLIFVKGMEAVAQIDTAKILAFSLGLSAVLLSLSISMAIMTAVGAAAVPSLAGMGIFLLLIAAVGGLLLGLGAAAKKWEEMGPLLDKGSEILAKIGHAIGLFIGSIFSGIEEGLNLPQVGKDLGDFMTNAQPFIDNAKNIDAKVVGGVSRLATAMMTIGKAEFINALVTMFRGENPITAFSEDIVTLASGIVRFAYALRPLNRIDDGLLDKGVDVATGLADIAAKLMPDDAASLIAVLTGVSGFTNFVTDMNTLGSGLVEFCKGVNELGEDEFDKDKVDAVVKIGQGLAQIEAAVSPKGGMLQSFTGTKSLAEFTRGFKGFGTGMKDLVTDISHITFNATPGSSHMKKIDAVITLAGKLAELENSLSAKGGFMQDLLGEKSLGAFAESFPAFSTGINSFITEITSMDEFDPSEDGEQMKKINAVIGIATALAKLENSVEEQGGWADDIMGEKSLGAFVKSFPAFTTGMNSFIDEITKMEDFDPNPEGEDMKRINSVIAVATALAELETILEPQEGKIQRWTGVRSLKTFGEHIAAAGTNIASFYNNVKAVKVDSGENAVTIMETVNEFVQQLQPTGSLAQELTELFATGSKFNTLLTLSGSMKTMGTDLKIFADSIMDVTTDHVDYGATIFQWVQDFYNGLDPTGGFWDDVAEFFGGSAENTIGTISRAMGTMGKNLQELDKGVAHADRTKANFDTAIEIIKAFDVFYSDWFKEAGAMNNPDAEIEHAWVFDNADMMADLGESLVTVSSYFADFHDNLAELSPDDIKNANSVFTALGVFTQGFGQFAYKDPIVALANLQTLLNGIPNLVLPDMNDEDLVKLQEFVTGLESIITEVNNQANSIAEGGAEAARSRFSNWLNAGKYLATGLANGIADMAATIKNAAVSAAQGAVNAIQVTWSIHSPSRVGKDLGMNFDLGIAKGLSKYSTVVSGTADDMSQKVVDSAATMLRGTDGSIFDNLDPNPTIRPVMDLSNVQNGVSSINGMMRTAGSKATSVFSGKTPSKIASTLNLEVGRMIGGFNDKNIVSSLHGMQDKIMGMGEKIGNMQLVLDSGALVGATSAMMDNSLGGLATMRQRAN